MDREFLKDRFHADQGLLLRPQGLRGLDFLGDDWEKYRGPYRPLAEPSPDESRRLIEFVRLVQKGDDESFRKEIASYLDVDTFLRFMAVQAMIANADGFFTLGYNDSLFLDPKTKRADQIIATGFLALGSKAHDAENRGQFVLDVVDEQIEATTRAFLGLTVACARCHDHKMDPIPQRDYDAPSGIFRSTQT